MAAYPKLATAIFAVGLLNLIKAGYSDVLPALLADQFPVETRAVGVAFSYRLSVTTFGGFAPFVATWLIAKTGDPLSPSYYLMARALLSILALVAVVGPRTAPRKLTTKAREVVAPDAFRKK
jgi:MFS transporter, MHS family, proline/betaine transporter